MKIISINEAKTNLSKIAEEVAAGKVVIVGKAGKPVMKLVPLNDEPIKITLGALKGKIKIMKDFDAPLSKEFLGF